MPNPVGARIAHLVNPNEQEAVNAWISWSAEAGLDVVDVARLTPEVKQAVDAAGIAIGSFDVAGVGALFTRDEAKRAGAAASIRKQLAEAAALGGKVCFMCLHPEDKTLPRRDSFAMFKESFPAITADAERLGIQIVLEGWPGGAPYYATLGCTPETLRAMFEAVPSPALCVNYDPSHLVRLGVDYLRFLKEFAGRTGHVHGKDTVILEENVYLYGRHQEAAFGSPCKFSEGPWRYTIPGEGSVDWAAVAFELDVAGYKGAVSIELEDHRYWNSTEERRAGLQKAAAHLRRFFG